MQPLAAPWTRARRLTPPYHCDRKVCDFGLSRVCAGPPSKLEEDHAQTNVTTRWYRAPELLCFNSEYGLAVDMWSVACILGEMLGRVAQHGQTPRSAVPELKAPASLAAA